MIKRIIDIGISLLLATVSFPIIIIAVVIIYSTIGRPVLIKQERTGLHNSIFKMYKLRSMLVNESTEEIEYSTGKNDKRITKFGNIIRKLRIDELPQLVNVIKGEMSLIGPRPEPKIYAEKYMKTIKNYHLRNSVKPGITGYAQVIHGYANNEESTKKKLEYDLFYVKNISLSLDFWIMIKTLKTILTGYGSK